MRKTVFLLITLFSLGIVFSFTVAGTWKIGNDHSILFSSADVNGIFKKFSGTVSFDEKNLPGSSFSLAIEVASLNTGNGLQNKHAKSDEWLDAAKYPQIKFISSKIEKTANAYVAKGTMEITGVKKEISIPFSFTRNGNKGIFTASIVVKRSEYNIGKPGGDVANDIKVDIKVPVTQ